MPRHLKFIPLLVLAGCGGCPSEPLQAPNTTPENAAPENTAPENAAPQAPPLAPPQELAEGECVPAPNANAHIAFTRGQSIDEAVLASLATAMGHRRIELHLPVIELPDGSGVLAIVSIDTSDPDQQIAEMWDIQTELWHLAIDEISLRRVDAIPTMQGDPIGSDGGAEDCYSIASFELADHDEDGNLELQLNANVGYMKNGTADEFRYVRVYSLAPLRMAFERRLGWSEPLEDDDELVARTSLRWADLNADSHPDMELTTTSQTCGDDCVPLGEPVVTTALWDEATDSWVSSEP